MTNPTEFDFVESYRSLQPTAERPIIVARENAHKAIIAEASKNSTRRVDLIRLAFGLHVPEQNGLDDWFGKAVRKGDKIISLERDKEEVARIATLALAALLRSNFHVTAALILAASFCGRRSSPDGGQIIKSARQLLSATAKTRKLSFDKIAAVPKDTDLSKSVASVAGSFDGNTVKSALDAMVAEARSTAAATVNNVNEAIRILNGECQRLAEEVDLLWWHIGGWSHTLDRPMSDVDQLALPIIIGNDVAARISIPPGPLGSFGIIKKALGTSASNEQRISDTLKAISPDDRPAVVGAKHHNANDLTVLNFGLRSLIDESPSSFGKTLKRVTGISSEAKLTRLDFAVQAFYERMFIDHGWL